MCPRLIAAAAGYSLTAAMACFGLLYQAIMLWRELLICLHTSAVPDGTHQGTRRRLLGSMLTGVRSGHQGCAGRHGWGPAGSCS